MQIFFAVSCLLAVLALSNEASVAPKSEQPRAEVEAQVAETAGQTRAVQVLATEQVASDGAAAELESTGTEETDGVAREKRTLLRHLLRKQARRGGCDGFDCGQGCAPVNPCLQAGGCETTNVAVVRQPVAVPTPVHVPVAVPTPVHVPVPVVKVVHHPVPVPQPIAVPVTKLVPVPVPAEQPCCGQALLPCSSCSG